jgi:catechol 2,3-dioxygenase-like lactoylglutathione lyase family enzyme
MMHDAGATMTTRSSPPYTLTGLDHIVFRAADAKALAAFYCDVLGCVPEREQAELGLIQLRAGRSLIDIVTLEGPLGRLGGSGPGAEGRNVDHICIGVQPFDEQALRAHLARHGVETEPAASRYGAEGEGLSIYLRDPEGNTVELKAAKA